MLEPFTDMKPLIFRLGLRTHKRNSTLVGSVGIVIHHSRV
jgi:hypothetical protein